MIPFRDNIPSRTAPVLTVTLIAVNVLVQFRMSLLSRAESQAAVWKYGLVPAAFAVVGRGPVRVQPPAAPMPVALFEPPPPPVVLAGTVPDLLRRLFASMFMHGGWLHLLSNMWFLWLFGDNVEDYLGRARYLALYLLSGVAAALAQVWVDWGTVVPIIGASGAVAGVLGAYMVTYPYARVLTLVPFFYFFWPIVELPAFLFLALWFLIQFVNGAGALGGLAGGVAWWAHIGGFVAGMALVKWLRPPRAVYYYRW